MTLILPFVVAKGKRAPGALALAVRCFHYVAFTLSLARSRPVSPPTRQLKSLVFPVEGEKPDIGKQPVPTTMF